jgi:hypothetical protein
MQINKLPLRLRELALRRRREYGFPGAEANDVQSLWCAFPWKDTPEGAHFWDWVDDGKYNVATRHLNRMTDEPKRKTATV